MPAAVALQTETVRRAVELGQVQDLAVDEREQQPGPGRQFVVVDVEVVSAQLAPAADLAHAQLGRRHLHQVAAEPAQEERDQEVEVAWKDGWKDAWMDGWMDGWKDAWMDGWMDGWKDAWMDGWKDGWMDGWMEGRVEGWVDG